MLYIRKFQLNCFAFGFAVMIFASLFYGLLGTAGVASEGTGWSIYVAGMIGWMVSGAYQKLRERV